MFEKYYLLGLHHTITRKKFNNLLTNYVFYKETRI
jgi:hypothetical protein